MRLTEAMRIRVNDNPFGLSRGLGDTWTITSVISVRYKRMYTDIYKAYNSRESGDLELFADAPSDIPDCFIRLAVKAAELNGYGHVNRLEKRDLSHWESVRNRRYIKL